MKKIYKTIVEVRRGAVFHVAFGFLAGILRCELTFTLIFLFKQILDLLSGDDPSTISGEVAEYASGLAVGLMIYSILMG